MPHTTRFGTAQSSNRTRNERALQLRPGSPGAQLEGTIRVQGLHKLFVGSSQSSSCPFAHLAFAARFFSVAFRSASSIRW